MSKHFQNDFVVRANTECGGAAARLASDRTPLFRQIHLPTV
jgi:hypothetical protein